MNIKTVLLFIIFFASYSYAQPPNLVSGETTCVDHYCILLTGSNFASNAYVDVRAQNSGDIIASYSGDDLIRGSSGNTDTLQFTILDPLQRQHLNSLGLRFYVVNPGNGWDGPVLVVRTLPSAVTGGTVLLWYDHNSLQLEPNDLIFRWSEVELPLREPKDLSIVMPFGIIKNYHKSYKGAPVRNLVKSQLEAMYQEGQRVIGINFFHGRGEQWISHGTFVNTRAKVDSLGDVFFIDQQYVDNLSMYLTDIKNQGFNSILFSVGPHGCNTPEVWVNWYWSCKKDIDYTFMPTSTTLLPDEYDDNNPDPRWRQMPLWKENWMVLKKISEILEGSGLAYEIDLSGEAIPSDDFESGFAQGCIHEENPNDPEAQCLKHHPEELDLFLDRIIVLLDSKWNKYVYNFGKTKTHGYSIIAPDLDTAQHRWATMESIYGANNYPNYLNLHMYVRNQNDAKQVFSFFKNKFPNTPIVIGETYYNDANTAQYLRRGLAETNTNIEYLIQWPLAPVDGVGIEGYHHLPPYKFNYYIGEGF